MFSSLMKRYAARKPLYWLLLAAAPLSFPVVKAENSAPAPKPAAVSQSTAAPAWLQGWSILKLRIPEKSDIQEAYADLQTPAGRAVTLTAGEKSMEGVTLTRLQWSGSPVQAKVTLQNGQETAALFVEVARIAKEPGLQQKEPRIGIEARLIEVPEAVAETLPIAEGVNLGPLSRGSVCGILTEDQLRQTLGKFAKRKEIGVLSKPQVTAAPRIRQVIELAHDKLAASAGEDGSSGKQTGVILEVEAAARDNTIDLMMATQIAEFKTLSTSSSAEPERQLLFSTRLTSFNVTIFSGQTVVLSGIQDIGQAAGAPPLFPGKMLFLLITARNLTFDEAPR